MLGKCERPNFYRYRPAGRGTVSLHTVRLLIEQREFLVAGIPGTSMLLSSWGRVTQRKTLQHLSHPVSTSCSSTTNVSRPFAPCTRTHRRRNSSSKSSNPQKDDPTTIAASPQAVTEKDASAAAASTTTPKKRLSTRISRQRSKDALEASSESRANALATRLPNVPSTQHLHIQGNL